MSFVAILMGSNSDWPIMQSTTEILDDLHIEYEVRITSAHRTPAATMEYVQLTTVSTAHGEWLGPINYDALGRVIGLGGEHGGGVTYDDKTNSAIHRTEFGGSVTSRFDSAGRLLAAADPWGHSMQVQYDDRGRRISVTDRKGESVTLRYEMPSVVQFNGQGGLPFAQIAIHSDAYRGAKYDTHLPRRFFNHTPHGFSFTRGNRFLT